MIGSWQRVIALEGIYLSTTYDWLVSSDSYYSLYELCTHECLNASWVQIVVLSACWSLASVERTLASAVPATPLSHKVHCSSLCYYENETLASEYQVRTLVECKCADSWTVYIIILCTDVFVIVSRCTCRYSVGHLCTRSFSWQFLASTCRYVSGDSVRKLTALTCEPIPVLVSGYLGFDGVSQGKRMGLQKLFDLLQVHVIHKDSTFFLWTTFMFTLSCTVCVCVYASPGFFVFNSWFLPFSKVTRLERDASSGTALQEISFWLNLENALNKIQLKRNSPEVNLTLDVLKAGKRFHATVSFDSDTGRCTVYCVCAQNVLVLLILYIVCEHVCYSDKMS